MIGTFIMLIGIPGSGKSTYAENYRKQFQDAIVCSSDSIRRELYGNESIQGNSKDIFELMNERSVSAIKNGKTVIFDATNIKICNRANALKAVSSTGCVCNAVFFDIPLNIAIARNIKRKRQVPNDVIRKMYLGMERPDFREGFQEIKVVCL